MPLTAKQLASIEKRRKLLEHRKIAKQGSPHTVKPRCQFIVKYDVNGIPCEKEYVDVFRLSVRVFDGCSKARRSILRWFANNALEARYHDCGTSHDDTLSGEEPGAWFTVDGAEGELMLLLEQEWVLEAFIPCSVSVSRQGSGQSKKA